MSTDPRNLSVSSQCSCFGSSVQYYSAILGLYLKSSKVIEKMKKTMLVPNGVVFFFDPSHPDIVIPMHDDDYVVDANDSSVSVFTQIDVDGEVSIELAKTIADSKKENLQQVFRGEIDAPGRKVAMSTSVEDLVLEVDVADTKANLSVWVNDLGSPDIVLVEAI